MPKAPNCILRLADGKNKKEMGDCNTMSSVVQACIRYLKKEIVLTVAMILALVSAFFVPPSTAYFSYIDWDTLALLFSMMAVMKGVQQAGAFDHLGNYLLSKTATSRQMLFILVFLPFFVSMLVTNDVALLTFVPFALIVLRMAEMEHLVVPLVVLQTLAANLGSMLTPMGNPQNLYFYTQSGFSFLQFCGVMAPYVLLSGVCIGALIFLQPSGKVSRVSVEIPPLDRRSLLIGGIGFLLCLLGIFDWLEPLLVAAVVAAFLLIKDRKLLCKVDYALLATFLAFFVFVGNMGSMTAVREFFVSILAGREVLVAVLASQIISNVPAALLLSGFSSQWAGLIVGCNLGGLGTLIASMASLISYKLVAKEYPGRRGRYFLWFTLSNLLLLGILLVAAYLL